MTEIEANSVLNRGDDLPYGYFKPELEGKLTWICGEDEDGRITSVFSINDGDFKDRRCAYLETIEAARRIRDELVNDGWRKIRPPRVTFTLPDRPK